MKRRYTEDVYNELISTINIIESDGVGTISDIVGDIFTHFQRWLGILNVNHYLDDIKTYQEKVLDANNTTIEELDRTFGAVETVDFTYRDRMCNLLTCAENYQKMIQTYIAMLSTGSTFTEESIHAGSGMLDKLLKETSVVLGSAGDEVYNTAAKQEVIKAGKELMADVVSFAKMLTSDPKKMVSNPFTGWKLINSVIAIGSDLGALAALGLGYLFARLTGSDSYKKSGIDMARECRETNNLTDYFNSYADAPDGYGKFWSYIADGTEFLDEASDTWDLISGPMYAFDESVNGDHIVAPDYQDKDYWDCIDKVFGIKAGEEGDNWIETANVWFNNADVAWNYAEELLDADGNLIEGFFDNFEASSDAKDIYEYIEKSRIEASLTGGNSVFGGGGGGGR